MGERSGYCTMFGVVSEVGLLISVTPSAVFVGRTEENLKMFLIPEIPSSTLNPEKSHSYPELLCLSSGSSNQRQDSASYLVIADSLCVLCCSLSLIILTFTFRPLNPNVATESRSYFHFKFPHLHLRGTAFFFFFFFYKKPYI
jgi:hypothetical protein